MNTTPCSKCGGPLPTHKDVCIFCNTPFERNRVKAQQSSPAITWLAAAALALVGLAFFMGDDDLTAEQIATKAQAEKCGTNVQAFVMSQMFVKDQLKSPATADFPLINAPGVAVVPDEDCRFSVRGFVDSQNGFGAMIRTAYTAQMQYRPTTKDWTLIDLVAE